MVGVNRYFAYEARRIKRWNSTEFHAYLKTCSVNKVMRIRIDNLAANDRVMRHGKSFDEFMEKMPYVWRNKCIERRVYQEMPLHAMAHGIGDDVIEFTDNILKSNDRGKKYADFVNEILKDVASFQLSWCKPKMYPKSAWVGENIMAYLRLFSYLYGMYFNGFPLDNLKQCLTIAQSRMINAYQVVLSVLMSPFAATQEQVKIIHEKIRLFLTAAHYLDEVFVPFKKHLMKRKNKA